MSSETKPAPHEREHFHVVPDSHNDPEHDRFPPPPRLQGQEGRPKPHIGPDFSAYEKVYKQSVGEGSDKWWAEQAQQLDWISQFKTVRAGGFEEGDIQWL